MPNKYDILIGTGLIIVWLMKIVFWPRKSGSEPGPHNNWRRDERSDAHQQFYESGLGDYGGHHGDGGGAH